MKCPKCSAKLKSVLTRSSVIVDVCTGCHGIWFDQGELRFFLKDRRALVPYASQGLLDAKEVLLSCPKCHEVNLRAGKLPGFRYEVEECPRCRGLFLDEHEIKKLADSDQFKSVASDQNVNLGTKPVLSASKKIPIPLPSLAFTSMMVLGSMYAVTFGLMVFLVQMRLIPHQLGLGLMLGFVLIQFVLGPVLMDWSLRLLGSLRWTDLSVLPPQARDLVIRVCKEQQIPWPRIGVIDDGAPQAYTYGRTPKSARLVLSRGILELLEPDEVAAVVAHEMGHIVHWDFVVMTLVQLVPLLLHYIYRTCYELSRNKKGERRFGGQLLGAAIVAYIAHWIAHYLVLFVSRLREYWADQFSVEATGNPNALARALSKIAFGLVSQKEDQGDRGDRGNQGALERRRMAVQALGIMSITESKEMALYVSQGMSERSKDLKDVMRWDLWSPWASYYELHSTHPLTAKRMNTLAAHAINRGIEPFVVFDLTRPESYWDDFAGDLFVLLLPVVGALVGGALFGWGLQFRGISPVWAGALGMSLGGILKTWVCYPGRPFLEQSVLSLLKSMKVSPVRSYPVQVRGRVIGRGDPGRVFSEDMVLRDSTGLIFLDYQHGMSNWYFALFNLNRFMGRDVEIEGWYRRGPTPFIEIKSIRSSDQIARSYTYYYKLLFWIVFPLSIGWLSGLWSAGTHIDVQSLLSK